MYREILKKLDDKRIESGVTFDDLAKITGCSADTCRNYLTVTGNKYFTYATVKKLAMALGADIEIPMDIVPCPICGKDFARPDSRTHYCSKECKHEGYLIVQRGYDRSKYNQKKDKKIKNKTLNEISKEAADLGMSYGKYVAMMEGRG